jgi:acyl-coenzyme A synthetase/AMP-(fatty) acid ligase/acyl carrier protein
VTCWKCDREEVEKGVAIGRPIANTQVYVLGEEMEPAGIGIAGELYLGGRGLGRGYLGRPELTAERWVPNPFSATEGERLYRTGDLVRFRADGNLEFLGRNDQQVKLRGFRIELGEIEAALLGHQQVSQVAVVMQGEGTEQSLAAYVVSRANSEGATELTGRELRESLRGKLPDYMVPSVFVMLETLPLTPSGKLDRKALPKPEQAGKAGQGYVAPRNVDEEILCDIFAEVLTLERVGVEDNFFELGGHSLLATQVISRVRNAFQIELSLQTMLEAPTVAGLSGRIEEHRCSFPGVLS